MESSKKGKGAQCLSHSKRGECKKVLAGEVRRDGERYRARDTKGEETMQIHKDEDIRAWCLGHWCPILEALQGLRFRCRMRVQDCDALVQVGVEQLAHIWIRSLQKDYELLPSRKDALSLSQFDVTGNYYKTHHPFLWALFSYAEVVEGYASQDPDVYKNEPTDAFIVPVDRYPRTVRANELCPKVPGVLALKIKVQQAQKWGMVLWKHPEMAVITSGVPISSM